MTHTREPVTDAPHEDESTENLHHRRAEGTPNPSEQRMDDLQYRRRLYPLDGRSNQGVGRCSAIEVDHRPLRSPRVHFGVRQR